MNGPHHDVPTTRGTIRGLADPETGATVFRDVPYAAAPIGPLRFAAPRRPTPWHGIHDATGAGTAPPQLSSPFAGLFGDPDIKQTESCLTLTIWSPPASGGPHPVLVWIPGGSYLTGTAALPRYSGAELAAQEDLVVVVVNYRLGALGFLAPEQAAPVELSGVGTELEFGDQPHVLNAGLLDQIAALRWINEEIGGFGGDPDRITVVGQSAGGHSVAALLRSPAVRPLITRAGLVSAPLGMPPLTRDAAAATAAEFMTAAGGAAVDPWTLSTDQVLAAQRQVLARPRAIGDVLPPFQPVSDGVLVPADLAAAPVGAGDLAGVELMIGVNRDECALWFADDRRIAELSHDELRDSFRRIAPESWRTLLAAYSGADGQAAAHSQVFQEFHTDRYFSVPCQVFADVARRGGARPFLYRFDWAVPGRLSRLGACHCADIPFLLGAAECRRAAMFADASAAELSRLRTEVRGLWGRFARTGSPEPDWPAFEPRRPAVRFLGGADRYGDSLLRDGERDRAWATG